jgi:hypothetical protein
MAMTSFVVDNYTAKAIADLKKSFGVKTNAGVIRKALMLATIAAEQAKDDHTVIIAGKDAVKVNIAT